MRLYIVNQQQTPSIRELQLSDGTNLELTDKSIIFSFDDLMCQRTSNIELPATPKNLKALDLSNDLHTNGGTCRRRLNATIVEGIVSIRGYVYVSSYNHSKKTFSVCFVGGELTRLIDIKAAGSIRNYLDDMTNTAKLVHITDAFPANFSNLPVYACVKRYSGNPNPSIDYDALINQACLTFGVSYPALHGANKLARLECGKINGIPEYSGRLVETRVQMQSPVLNASGFADRGVNPVGIAAVETLLKFHLAGMPDTTYNLYCYQALTPIEIRIDSGLDSSSSGHRGHTIQFIKGEPYTPYSTGSYFGQVVNGYNDVITGEWYQFATGDIFALVDADNVLTGGGQGYDTDAFIFDCNITIRSSVSGEDLVIGDMIRLRDNLPDVTLIDLMKYMAALEGKILYYTEANGFSFEDIHQSETRELDNIISMTEQRRTIGDMAQSNIVELNHDGVSESYQSSISYEIDNDNIDERKVLITLPYSEGDGREGKTVTVTTDNWSIYNASEDSTTRGEYCTKVVLEKNSSLENVFSAATELIVEAPMTLLEYTALHPLVRILCRNAAWMWIEKRWKEGICTLKLVKI